MPHETKLRFLREIVWFGSVPFLHEAHRMELPSIISHQGGESAAEAAGRFGTAGV